jgi:hypothetical protein
MDTSVAGKLTWRIFDGTEWLAIWTVDIATNALSFSGAAMTGVAANVSFGQVNSVSGDLWAHGWGGNDNVGVVFLNGARNRYLLFDGNIYSLPTSSLYVATDQPWPAIVWGNQGAYLGGDGNLFGPIFGSWGNLSARLAGIDSRFNTVAPSGNYAVLGYNQFGDTQYIYWTGAAKTVFAVQASIGSFDQQLMQLRTNRGSSTGYKFLTAIADYDNTKDTKFSVRGDGQVSCDLAFAGGGADYAEFFEWADGNPSKEDRVGRSVVLDGEKIALAKQSDDPELIIGVVSGNPTVVGDAQEIAWVGQYMKDEYGRRITHPTEVVYWSEDVRGENGELREQTRSRPLSNFPSRDKLPEGHSIVTDHLPVVNPEYRADAPYVPRDQRPEWAAIGLMGKLVMMKGQPRGARWIKLADVSETTERVLVR